MHRFAAFALIVSICGIAAIAALPSTADAQTADRKIVVAQNDSVGNFFRRLFRPRDAAPQPQVPRQQLQRSQPQQPQRRSRRTSPAPAPREMAAIEKSEDAKRVLVVGDFLATALAKGLALTYQENPDVVVIDATSGSSGLVRNDYYDWPGKLPSIAEEQNPDAILVLVGGNDRQGIDTASGPYALGTDGWRTAYASRVNALAEALRATGKPALWVGLMPVQSSTMSRDYSSFNGIVREQLETKGIPFIDTWNGFADAEGKFVAVGPDIRGQSVQLRASDGLNFTRAGQRKLAFFVEQELQDIFGGIAPQLAATSTGLGTGEAGPQIGPMVPLDALASAGGEELAGASGDDSGVAATEVADRLAGEEPAPQGRADDYRWPLPEPEPEPAALETSVPAR
jgi:hypothetical protein